MATIYKCNGINTKFELLTPNTIWEAIHLAWLLYKYPTYYSVMVQCK